MSKQIALVGIGKIARDQHLPALIASKQWQLAATVSRSATLPGIINFSRLEHLLTERPDIKCISLTLPALPRFKAAQQAILAGRHVMLEKPPAASISDAFILKQLAKQNRISLFTSWHSRAAAAVPTAKRWLQSRQVKSVQITWHEDVHKWHPGQTWIWQTGGMGVFDPGINALSILTHILPAPLRLKQAKLWIPENCVTPIAAKLQLTQQETIIHADFDFRQQGDDIWDITISSTDGILQLHQGGAQISIDGKIQRLPPPELHSGPHSGSSHSASGSEYQHLYRHFARIVAKQEQDIDFIPLILVNDALAMGERITVAPFEG